MVAIITVTAQCLAAALSTMWTRMMRKIGKRLSILELRGAQLVILLVSYKTAGIYKLLKRENSIKATNSVLIVFGIATHLASSHFISYLNEKAAKKLFEAVQLFLISTISSFSLLLCDL